MIWIRDIRKKSVMKGLDPWIFRQALIMAIEIDTKSAINRGIPPKNLEKFDKAIKEDMEKWFIDLKN